MANSTNIFISVVSLFILIVGCNNNEGSSPYEEILSRPPYSKLTDSIHQNSSDPELYYRRGMLLYKNNNNPPALADLRKAWSLNKREIYAMNISNILMQEKPDSAISFLHEALNVLPESIPLHINLVQAYAEEQKIDEALSVCDLVLRKHPDQVGVLMMKSDILEQKGDSMGSLNALQKAYRYAPANEDLCYNLAFKYAQIKDPKALILCDSLLRNDTMSKKAEPYYFKGVYYSNINDKARALDLFNKAIENDYTFLDAYMDKGRTLFDLKKYPDAAKVFQLVLRISSTYADAYYWLGRSEESLGQTQDAKLNYQRAYGLDKSLTEAKEAADKLK